MVIEFKREIFQSELLDPSMKFDRRVNSFEIRIDPLTQRKSYVLDPQGISSTRGMFSKRDLSPWIQKSLEVGCPFCPEAIDKATPKFIPELFPEGRTKLGEACVFPNTLPWSQYAAITVLSSQHFIGLPDFSQETLTNGFIVSQSYLKRVQEYDAEAKYLYVGWNYMPPSGGSQLHPHLQPAAATFPTPYQKELLEASQQYYIANGTNFWSDLVTEEQQLGERYIGNTGNICWLTSFAPKGFVDILAIFQHRDSFMSISDQEFKDFSIGLQRVFRYMSDQNFYSFNLSITSGLAGDNYFWTQARLIPRLFLTGIDTTDVDYRLFLQDLRFGMRHPEDICLEVKEYFEG